MKIFYILLFALGTFVSTSMAQPGGHNATPMKFAGKANFVMKNMTGAEMANVDLPSDTVAYLGTEITIPRIAYGQMVIPSFIIHNVQFELDRTSQTMTVNFPEQTFSETMTVNGEEKVITGTSLKGTYKHDSWNTFELSLTFSYGSMPMPITYTITAYYIKAYTDRMDIVIDKDYKVESVTYNVRTYPDGDVTKLDVEVPTFSMAGTTIGDLTSGGYTVKGLTMDADKGGYYRDYHEDGIKMHFQAGRIDGDYALSAAADQLGNQVNYMLVSFDQKAINIKNVFKPGSMPFAIDATFPGTAPSGINTVANEASAKNAPAYDLSGQRVANGYKGLVIFNGKKTLKK